VKKLVPYIAIFFIAFISAGSAAYFSVRLFTKNPGEIVLPQLKGKNIIYVLETLTQLGLNAKLYGTRNDENIPRYNVISQDPIPGTIIKKGRDVVIYISKGSKENIIPDLRQFSLKEARLVLEKEEFIMGKISKVYNRETPAGSIIAQYPKPFTSVLNGSACNFLVSRGHDIIGFTMPDLLGTPLERASELLEANNLQVFEVTSDVQPGIARGLIIRQSPEFGNFVNKTSKITLFVNNSEADREMDPESLNGVIAVKHLLKPGFLKKHVKVEADLFGTTMVLYDNYAKPSEEILVLIPSGIKTKVNFYIDNILIKTRAIDPWQENNTTGEITWE
jgi:eukaryotic-like serine/threonine-protein kinase